MLQIAPGGGGKRGPPCRLASPRMHARPRSGALLLLAGLLLLLGVGTLPVPATAAPAVAVPAVAAPGTAVPGVASHPVAALAPDAAQADVPAILADEVPFPGRLLGAGLVGDDVRQLQAYLNSAGARLEVDGIYGRRTARAVRQLQRRVGVPADGIVGPTTWARGPALAPAVPPPAAPSAPAAPATTAPATTATTTATTAAPAAPAAAPTAVAPVTTAAPATTAPTSTPVDLPSAAAASAGERPDGRQEGAVWIVVVATLALIAAFVAVVVLDRRRDLGLIAPSAKAPGSWGGGVANRPAKDKPGSLRGGDAPERSASQRSDEGKRTGGTTTARPQSGIGATGPAPPNAGSAKPKTKAKGGGPAKRTPPKH